MFAPRRHASSTHDPAGRRAPAGPLRAPWHRDAAAFLTSLDPDDSVATLAGPAGGLASGFDFGSVAVAPPMQAKLEVGGADDPAEREADERADLAVGRGRGGRGGHTAPVPAAPVAPPGEDVERVVRAGTAGGGHALDARTRADMEARLGHDFSRVRVHTGRGAAASAAAVRAQAYTVGADIVFGEGRYAPGGQRGRHLLAHELAHVAQQRAAPALHGAPASTRAAAGGPVLQRRPVCDAGGACYEVDDSAPPQPGELNYTPAAADQSYSTPAASPAQAPAAASHGAAVPASGAAVPLAAGMVSPGLPTGGPPLPPPPIPEGPLPFPRVPGEAPFRPPTLPPVEVPPVAPVGPGASGAAQAARGAPGVLSWLRYTVGLTPAAAGALVGLGVLLYPSSTAQPWEDELNPVTGGPYRSREEYARVRAMSREQIIAARQALGAPGTPDAVRLPGAPGQAPVREPGTPGTVSLPAGENRPPAVAPGAGTGSVVLPGAPGSGPMEAANRRSRTGRGGGRQTNEDYTDPLTGEPFEGEVLQPNNPLPTYNPATGLFEDPARGISRTGFNSLNEALEHFEEHVEPNQRPLRPDPAGETPVRTTNVSESAVGHLGVYSAEGAYVGTIYRNVIASHTFYTWSRGRH